MRTFQTYGELTAAVSEELGVSDWIAIDQARVDAFAECTDDYQWIHVDQVQAAAGPFGATVAHGFLTMSLIPLLGAQIFLLDTPGAKLNYGVNKVRFPTPLRVGSRIRARATLADVRNLASGMQVVVKYVIEIEGEDKPACVAETVALLLPDTLSE
jgi:acyl dehydratase